MTCDGDGNVWVAWSSDRDGDYNIYVSRTLAIGGVRESESSQQEPRLEVFPDPFRGATSIRYTIPESGDVRIVFYNLLGEHVKTLLEEHQSAGHYTVVWDGTDSSGRRVPSNTYFLRLQIRQYTATRKVIWLR
jgi:flagellar hook assembly protein FlgD